MKKKEKKKKIGKYICNDEKCIDLAIKKKRINREDLLNAKERRNG